MRRGRVLQRSGLEAPQATLNDWSHRRPVVVVSWQSSGQVLRRQAIQRLVNRNLINFSSFRCCAGSSNARNQVFVCWRPSYCWQRFATHLRNFQWRFVKLGYGRRTSSGRSRHLSRPTLYILQLFPSRIQRMKSGSNVGLRRNSGGRAARTSSSKLKHGFARPNLMHRPSQHPGRHFTWTLGRQGRL